MKQPDPTPQGDVRFAVVGLGHIAQAAVLPAFEQASGCELAALVSGDSEKLKALGKRYRVRHTVDYDGYDALLKSGEIDAVYIALPNELHAEYTVRAATRGVHVLCEKPLAVTEEECEEMIHAAEVHGVRLMAAYRLHFEHINLDVVELVNSGAIGKPRMFSSVFSQNVKQGDVRLAPWEKGGGSVFDMGVYCINAARYLFRDEPVEIIANSTMETDARFASCDEMTGAVLRFSGGQIAQFCSSFGAVRSGAYQVVGTKGEVVVHNAYDYAKEIRYEPHTQPGDVRTRRIAKRDQFAPQLEYFAECIRLERDPEPDAWEGYADVRIVRAIHESVRTGQRVRLLPMVTSRRPTAKQARWKPGIDKPEEINAEGPGR
jgi:glucose-fructose oxidoreductase